MTCGKRYLALLLCLLLLAGCGGNPYRDIPAPPEQPPEERQAEFLTFLKAVNDRRPRSLRTRRRPYWTKAGPRS